MKNSICLFVLAFCLLMALMPQARATDFVPINQGDVLVITHEDLLTPGWYPGMIDVWETELLAQKQTQGYSVALYAISDGSDQFSIRQYLENNQGHFRFIYIIGEARRPENDVPVPFIVPFTDFDNGNIVPVWREVVQTLWQPYDGLYVVENDRGYIENIDSVCIGRIPAANTLEIMSYLAKSGNYISIEHQFPEWSKNILEAVNDVTSFDNGSSGPYVQAFWDAWEAEFPPGWPPTRLAISTGPATEEERASLFENHLNNNHYGLIHVVGTTGCDYLLADWYYGDSQYNFTNFDYLPFMLGMSCHIGAFDRYWEGVENECVVEKMLFHPNGGIIGTIAPTGGTLLPLNCVFPMRFWNVILSQNILNFGEILNVSIEQASGDVPIADFTLKMLMLLGDPTLNLPYDLAYAYLAGDVNMHAGGWPPVVTGPDVTYLLNFFRDYPTSVPCKFDGDLGLFWASADANGDCLVTGSDITKLTNVLRGIGFAKYCGDQETDNGHYEPAWPPIPGAAPLGWPNCE